MQYTKPTKTIPDLIAYLINKGLSISDPASAIHSLNYIGYYRLKIYMRYFQTNGRFHAGVNFEDIVELYDFDRDLRMICLDALDTLEIALRANLVNVMGLEGGPHFYYEEKYFECPSPKDKRAKDAVSKFRALATKWPHATIDHYKKKYNDPFLPPIWCLTEATSISDISTTLADLKTPYRKKVAKGFGLQENLVVSWFRSLSTLRNVCAHHGRLWNAHLSANAPEPHTKKYNAHFPFQTLPNGKVKYTNIESSYVRLVIIKILLDNIDPITARVWKDKLLAHIRTRPSLQPAMGFPAGWDVLPLWT